MPKVALWRLDEGQPLRLPDHQDFLERHLEAWIERDPSLILDGLRWVGRQVQLPNGRLDLLGITRDGRWVVAELKSGPLYLDAISQAIYYGMQIGSMDAEDLLERLNLPADRSMVGAEDMERLRRFAKSDAQTPRPLLLLLVGTSQADDLEQGMQFLEQRGLQVPIRVVTFSVFRQPDGSVLLAREVEEQDEPQQQPSSGGWSATVEKVLTYASECGVRQEAEEALAMGARLHLGIKGSRWSFNIQAPVNRKKMLLYFGPEQGAAHVGYSPENFAEEFGATESELKAVLGPNWQTIPKAAAPRWIKNAEDLLRVLMARAEKARAEAATMDQPTPVSPRSGPTPR